MKTQLHPKVVSAAQFSPLSEADLDDIEALFAVYEPAEKAKEIRRFRQEPMEDDE